MHKGRKVLEHPPTCMGDRATHTADQVCQCACLVYLICGVLSSVSRKIGLLLIECLLRHVWGSLRPCVLFLCVNEGSVMKENVPENLQNGEEVDFKTLYLGLFNGISLIIEYEQSIKALKQLQSKAEDYYIAFDG